MLFCTERYQKAFNIGFNDGLHGCPRLWTESELQIYGLARTPMGNGYMAGFRAGDAKAFESLPDNEPWIDPPGGEG